MSFVNLRTPFFVMVFFSTTDTISTEKELQKKFRTMIIPTPREISKSCGFAIRFSDAAEEDIIAASKLVEAPHTLYFINYEDEGGRTARFVEGVF